MNLIIFKNNDKKILKFNFFFEMTNFQKFYFISKNFLYYYCCNNSDFQSKYIETTTGTVVIGGDYDLDSCYIPLTVIDNASPDDLVMQEEIFGPILPIIECERNGSLIKSRPKNV